MARRKAKKPTPEDELSMLLEETPAPGRRTHAFVSPALLFIVTFTLGAFVVGWFLVQQQQSLDQLSESFTAAQQRVTNFQQMMGQAGVQADSDPFVEDRIFALEKAQKQAWEKAEVVLATTEKLKNPDLLSKLWELRSEMDTQWDVIQQAALTVKTLHAMFKNQSEEFEVIQQRLAASLSSSLVMPEHVAGLTSAVASVCSRIDEQVASAEVLSAQLQGQNSKLNDLKELVYLHNVALHTHTHEMDALQGLFKEKQVMRAQALEEMLGLVQMTLDEQFLTSQTLHSSIMAQLQTIHSQLANQPSWPIAHKSHVEVVSMTTQNTVEQDTEEKAQRDVEDGADEEVMLEEQPAEMGEDITEEQEEEHTPGVEEEITGQGEEEEKDKGDTAEQTVTGHVLNESLEEEVSEEDEEDWDSAEVESVFVETDEEEQF